MRNAYRGGGGGGAPGSGDIEGVTAGSGLTGGGTTGTVSLAVDHATAAPPAQGTAAVGSATKSAREDHVHPMRCRYVVGSWHASNIPANTAAGNVFFVDGNSNFDGYVVPRACVLTGISVRTSVASAGSELKVNVKVNGVQSALLEAAVALGSRVGYAVGTGPTLAAGDLIQPVYVTDASWTATTSDASVLLEFTEV